MRSRDLFREIHEVRSRNPRRKGPFSDALSRLDPLTETTRPLLKKSRFSKVEKEFIRYTPVAAIALVEGCFKGLMCDLINVGSPFLQNAADFKEVRVSLEALVGTHTREITVGELLIHPIRINCLEDIDRHMSVVLGLDFLKTLKSEESFPAKYLAGVTALFEARHILAHEIAPDYKTTPNENSEFLLCVFCLLLATEHYIQHTVLANPDDA